MDLKQYKKLHKKYSGVPLEKEVWDTPEFEAYLQAFHTDKACQEWDLRKRIKEAGINYKKYCCLDMASNLIEDKLSKNKEKINYDSVITHNKKGKDYGIPIHDGGNSYSKINYCPWCGQNIAEG